MGLGKSGKEKITQPREGNSITDSEIIENVSKELGMSLNKIAKVMNAKSSMSVYNVSYGFNNLNDDLINRFKLYLPSVSEDYLRFGQEPILLEKKDAAIELSEKMERIIESQSRIEGMLLEILSR